MSKGLLINPAALEKVEHRVRRPRREARASSGRQSACAGRHLLRADGVAGVTMLTGSRVKSFGPVAVLFLLRYRGRSHRRGQRHGVRAGRLLLCARPGRVFRMARRWNTALSASFRALISNGRPVWRHQGIRSRRRGIAARHRRIHGVEIPADGRAVSRSTAEPEWPFSPWGEGARRGG